MDELDPNTDGVSLDIVADNIDKMRRLFPEVFTEGRVDFDALHDVLGDYIDDRQERYSLSWHGKATSRRIAQTPSNGSLRPCPEESVAWDTTENLFIEGDNLEVLKLLQKSYYGRVKVIYIDPPYNTGGEFVYPDKYQDSLETYLRYTGQVDADGLKLTANAESSGRYHTNWLNMMYPRLKAARNLLREDGVIFVSIDDNEQPRLRLLCDEVFGEENFIATLVHQRAKGGGQAKYVVKGHDYVLVYARDLSCGDVALRRQKVVQGRTIEKDRRTYLLNDDVVRKKFGKYDKDDGDRRCSYEELLEYKGEEKKAEIDASLAAGELFLQKGKDGRHIICRL